MKIVVLDGYTLNPGDLSWDSLAALGDCNVYDRTPPDEIAERAAGAEIVLTNKVVLDRTRLERLPDLRYIGVLATGYNVVDARAAHQHQPRTAGRCAERGPAGRRGSRRPCRRAAEPRQSAPGDEELFSDAALRVGHPCGQVAADEDGRRERKSLPRRPPAERRRVGGMNGSCAVGLLTHRA